jgi:hypothetical protein
MTWATIADLNIESEMLQRFFSWNYQPKQAPCFNRTPGTFGVVGGILDGARYGRGTDDR